MSQTTTITQRESRVTNNPGSWHNPTAQDLRQLDENIWVIERGYVDHGMDVGGKTTIIRLTDGRLFIHSALPISEELRVKIAALGTVSAVVAPNAQHLDFIKNWKLYFPEATCLAPPGVKASREDVPFDDEMLADGTPHAAYDDGGSIQQVYLAGCPIMSEMVFLHVPSKTLVVTDMVFTFPNQVPFGTRIAKFILANAFKPVHKHFLVKDKELHEKAVQEVEKWDFETLVPCHGDVVTEGAREAFNSWLGRA